MSYTLFYVSEDVAHRPHGVIPLGTWSVYSEQYESIDAPEPIEHTNVHVAGGMSHDSARAMATARQRASYGENRKAGA